MTFEERAKEWAARIDASKTNEEYVFFLLLAMNSLRSEYPEHYASVQPTAGPPAVPALPSGARQEGPGAKLIREARELREKYEPLTEGAADAASPSAAQRGRLVALALLRRLPFPEEAKQAAEIVAAAEAARDARWREALRESLGVGAYLALQTSGHRSHASLRTLLGSVATAPTPAPEKPAPPPAAPPPRPQVVIGEAADGWHVATSSFPDSMFTACGKTLRATRFETTDAARGHTFCIACLNAWPEPEAPR